RGPRATLALRVGGRAPAPTKAERSAAAAGSHTNSECPVNSGPQMSTLRVLLFREKKVLEVADARCQQDYRLCSHQRLGESQKLLRRQPGISIRQRRQLRAGHARR